MGTKSTHSLVLKGVDKVSNVLDKISRKFPKLRKNVRKAAKTFLLLQKRTEKLRKSLRKMGRGMTSVGKKMSMGLSAPLALAGAAILRVGVTFEKSMNKVAAITDTIIDGKVSPAFEALEKEALKLGATTEFSATQAADAMIKLGRAGFKTSEILAATSDVLALATASGSELAFTADVMAKTIRAFGLEATDAQRVSDVLADVSRKTNVDLQTLSETFKDAAPIAAAYGATLEQTAAITGLLGDVGIQGSKAGTTLKSIMLKLAAPSKKAGKILEKLGIQVSTAANGMNDVGSILSQLAPALGKFPKQAQLAAINELFGLRGIAGASALMSKAIKEGKNPIATLTKVLQGSTGAAKAMQKTMLRGSVGALARFRSALEGVGLAFAKSGMLEAFADLLEMLAKLFSKLSALSPAILKTIAIIGGLVTVIGPLLVGLGFMVTGFTALLPVFAAIKVAAIAVGGVLALVTAPVWLIIAAVVVLIAAVARIISVWDRLVASFKAGKGVIDTIGKILGTFFGFSGSEKKLTVEAKGSFGTAKGALGALGEGKGAKAQLQNISQNKNITQTNNSIVDVNFRNAPDGTRVVGNGPGLGRLNMGNAGGLQ